MILAKPSGVLWRSRRSPLSSKLHRRTINEEGSMFNLCGFQSAKARTSLEEAMENEVVIFLTKHDVAGSQEEATKTKAMKNQEEPAKIQEDAAQIHQIDE